MPKTPLKCGTGSNQPDPDPEAVRSARTQTQDGRKANFSWIRTRQDA